MLEKKALKTCGMWDNSEKKIVTYTHCEYKKEKIRKLKEMFDIIMSEKYSKLIADTKA